MSVRWKRGAGWCNQMQTYQDAGRCIAINQTHQDARRCSGRRPRAGRGQHKFVATPHASTAAPHLVLPQRAQLVLAERALQKVHGPQAHALQHR